MGDYRIWDIRCSSKSNAERGDGLYCKDSGTVSDYLKNNKLHSVFLTKEADVSFAVQQGEPVLLSILNKTLTSMPTAQFSGA